MNLEEKGIIHALGELIGFEEANLYWNILINNVPSQMNKSKKYRVFRSLFEQGLLLKIRDEGIFHYVPFPPNFLEYAYGIKSNYLKMREDEYIKRYLPLILKESSFFESSGKMIDYLILFLVKTTMKKNFKILLGGKPIYDLVIKTFPKLFEKSEFIGIKEFFRGEECLQRIKLIPREIISDRRFCIIDDSCLVVFLKTLNNVYFGYITHKKDLVSEKQREFDFLKAF